MPKMVQRRCKNCGDPFMARAADVKRGWGNFCTKSCKASKQEKRTGQYARHLHQVYETTKWGDEDGGGLEESIDFEGGGFYDYKDVSGNTGHLDA
jgi:hypothetical protein